MRARGFSAVLALVLIGLVLAAWLLPRRRHAGRSTEPGDAVVEQALRQAREGSGTVAPDRKPSSTGSEEDKSRWVPEVKGFDASDLNRDRRTLFIRFANAERCTCGCGYTLAGCRTPRAVDTPARRGLRSAASLPADHPGRGGTAPGRLAPPLSAPLS